MIFTNIQLNTLALKNSSCTLLVFTGHRLHSSLIDLFALNQHTEHTLHRRATEYVVNLELSGVAATQVLDTSYDTVPLMMCERYYLSECIVTEELAGGVIGGGPQQNETGLAVRRIGVRGVGATI